MLVGLLDQFDEVVLADFEFSAPPGERPRPVCLVARELRSRRVHRIFEDELHRMAAPPYPIGNKALFVAYYASAELTCHLALGWQLPAHVLDLYVEFSNRRNGLLLIHEHRDLLSALIHHGLDAMEAVEKDSMRQLAIRGGPFTEVEKRDLLAYCESDVAALEKLLQRMAPTLDIPRAVLRGRSMVAAARIEHNGIPLDVPALTALRRRWAQIQDRLIQLVDADYGVYEGTTFKAKRWADYLVKNDIPWPMLQSGELALDDDTFRQMARSYEPVRLVQELRCSLSQMRLEDLAVGNDGRNRVMLSAFRAKTGRNQPSNTKFIFGPATWLRGLICPQPGCGVAYIDWSQQEFGIAAALSGDGNMLAAYDSGDPYLAFAKQAGAAPADATKKTHAAVREQFKACVLGVQYAMGADTLALRINQCPAAARELLRMHRETYPKFWRWSDAAVDYAMLYNKLHTTFGWTIHAGPLTNPRSLRNFPTQANGAEMLRFACCFATERGIAVCAPVHDAILIEARLEDLDCAVAAAQAAMSDASALVLDGFRLRSDAKIVRYPERYEDERGKEMWQRVWGVMAELSQDAGGMV
jgi:DNA polymerase I